MHWQSFGRPAIAHPETPPVLLFFGLAAMSDIRRILPVNEAHKFPMFAILLKYDCSRFGYSRSNEDEHEVTRLRIRQRDWSKGCLSPEEWAGIINSPIS
jgi:hypothetical protein